MATDNRLSLPRLVGEPQAAWVKLLTRALNQNSTMRISLAGGSAQEWRDTLVEHGVRAARLELENDVDQPGLLLQRLP